MMNDSTQERIELSLHTTVSDDVSVISPREAIEAAVKLGHKAVAVTNLNSVQDFPELEDCRCRYGNNLKVIYGAQVHNCYNEPDRMSGPSVGLHERTGFTEGIKTGIQLSVESGE